MLSEIVKEESLQDRYEDGDCQKEAYNICMLERLNIFKNKLHLL
jgi:hypothetical protein